jgi:hypothetical protein
MPWPDKESGGVSAIMMLNQLLVAVALAYTVLVVVEAGFKIVDVTFVVTVGPNTWTLEVVNIMVERRGAVTVETDITVAVRSGRVMVEAAAPIHEHALEYQTAPEHAEAYAGMLLAAWVTWRTARGGRALRAAFDAAGGMSRAVTAGCVGGPVTVVVLVIRRVESGAVISITTVRVEFCVGLVKAKSMVET